jgi:hypothetical protein
MIVLTITHRELLQKSILIRGTAVMSGNYTTVAGGGDAVNFNAATCNPGEIVPEGMALPRSVQITGVNGYQYGYIPGTSRANGLMKVSTAANTELAGAPTAYPAGVTGDTVTFEATFGKGA